MHPNILKIMDPKERHKSWPIFYESRHKGGTRLAPPILDLWWNHEVVRDLCHNMPQWTPEITSSWLCHCGFLPDFLRNGDNGDKSDKTMKWKVPCVQINSSGEIDNNSIWKVPVRRHRAHVQGLWNSFTREIMWVCLKIHPKIHGKLIIIVCIKWQVWGIAAGIAPFTNTHMTQLRKPVIVSMWGSTILWGPITFTRQCLLGFTSSVPVFTALEILKTTNG